MTDSDIPSFRAIANSAKAIACRARRDRDAAAGVPVRARARARTLIPSPCRPRNSSNFSSRISNCRTLSGANCRRPKARVCAARAIRWRARPPISPFRAPCVIPFRDASRSSDRARTICARRRKPSPPPKSARRPRLKSPPCARRLKSCGARPKQSRGSTRSTFGIAASSPCRGQPRRPSCFASWMFRPP